MPHKTFLLHLQLKNSNVTPQLTIWEYIFDHKSPDTPKHKAHYVDEGRERRNVGTATRLLKLRTPRFQDGIIQRSNGLLFALESARCQSTSSPTTIKYLGEVAIAPGPLAWGAGTPLQIYFTADTPSRFWK